MALQKVNLETQADGTLPSGSVASFDSGEIVFSVNANHTAAHGFSSIPTLWSVVLRCKTAEYGYVVGDELSMPVYQPTGTAGNTAYADATNIGFRVGAQITVSRRDAVNTDAAITAGNWRVVMRAWDI